jgi:hypothetical protein
MHKGHLRLRILKTLSGSIDGIQLGRFRAGSVYEFGSMIASYLLAIGAAEPADDEPATILPPDQQLFGPVAKGHGHTLPFRRDRSIAPSEGSTVRRVRDKAADRRRKKR